MPTLPGVTQNSSRASTRKFWTSGTSCAKIAFAKRLNRQMGKRNKDLEPSFTRKTDLGPALGHYSAMENSRQNCTFCGVFRGR